MGAKKCCALESSFQGRGLWVLYLRAWMAALQATRLDLGIRTYWGKLLGAR
jgi:hypothetical protein